jgi:hypothetical protein
MIPIVVTMNIAIAQTGFELLQERFSFLKSKDVKSLRIKNLVQGNSINTSEEKLKFFKNQEKTA